jgi:hypothetical protein
MAPSGSAPLVPTGGSPIAPPPQRFNANSAQAAWEASRDCAGWIRVEGSIRAASCPVIRDMVEVCTLCYHSRATTATMFRFCNRFVPVAIVALLLLDETAATKHRSSPSESTTRELEGLTGPFSHMACRACTKYARTYVVQGTSGLAGCVEADDAEKYAQFRLTNGADCIFKSNHGEVVVAVLVLVAMGILLVNYGHRLNQFLATPLFFEGNNNATSANGAATETPTALLLENNVTATIADGADIDTMTEPARATSKGDGAATVTTTEPARSLEP